MKDKGITIDYFSDILCIWAWITQRRIDELNKQFENKIEIRFQYIDIFGDAISRITDQWADKGLFEGFSDHVINSAAPYEAAVVNHDVWRFARPATSANAHMVLKAIELAYGKESAINFAVILRKSFFVDAEDIGNLETIFSLVKSCNIDLNPIQHEINSGSALAALMHDYQAAKKYEIKGSPCFVMNEGRQILFGNVGYRVLRTNIEELLTNPKNEASWC